MHLTQQQQLNQMCPPPLGPPATWFMNHHHHPQPNAGFPPPPPGSYHNYQQNYYSTGVGGSNVVSPSSGASNGSQQHQHQHQPHQSPQPNHLHQHHQHQSPIQQAQHPQQYNYSSYHQPTQQTQLHHNQQYNQIHQQPLTIQQPQSQHAHHHQQQQQQSPIIHQQQQQQLQPQLSPHAPQSRPSSTHHHQPQQHQQQPSPNHYQQHSPLNQHLTSPSLQPSPVLHHQQPQQQHSPHGRQHQQPTPPHHAPTPTSQQQQQHHTLRPASVKESAPTSHHASNILQTEVRVFELNRRLQTRPNLCYRTSPLPTYDQYNESDWWEEFMNDFFKEDATLTLSMQADDKPVRYILRRSLIARFFRSYFDGGVTELSINLRNSKELRGGPNQVIVLECDHANIVTKNLLKHPKVNSAPRVVVCTEGHLSIEFVGNNLESWLIKSWNFRINQCREYIDRSITAMGLPNTLLVEPTTFQGLPSSTMIYLKMCSVMEPMQELMSQYKLTNMEPKQCLKKLLFDKYRFKSDDDLKIVGPTKRRKRKQPSSPAATPGRKAKVNSNMSNSSITASSLPPVTTIVANLPPLTLMIVGEPSSMGSEYRDDNERSITKIENSNYVVPAPTEPVESNLEPDEVKLREEEEELDEVKEEDELVKEELPEAVIEKEKVDETFNQSDAAILENEEVKQNTIQQDSSSSQQRHSPSEPEIKMEEPTDVAQPPPTVVCEDKPSSQPNEEQSTQVSEEPIEKENNNMLALNEETQKNSTATQSESHYNIMNSIPEDREDTCRSTSCDSLVAKLPPSSNNKNTLTSNGSNNKQNRRRSSERKETLREGLMEPLDFVVKIVDLQCEHPALWRITTGNNLLQRFGPKAQNGVVLYENTNEYAGWNPEIKKEYVGVDVKLTQHTRNQITVEKLQLNFQKLEDPDAFYDKHFVIYLQILISTALDSKFWESIENEPKHHDYFLTSYRIIEDITKRFKSKLSNKLKLNDASVKNIEKYPNLLVKHVDKEHDKEQLCRACNKNLSTTIVSFGNRSYDMHSYKPVKMSNELAKTDDKDMHNNLCDLCLELVKLYSEIHHMGYKFYNLAREKVDLHRTKSKPINAILDECLKDEDWLTMLYAERDALWSQFEHI